MRLADLMVRPSEVAEALSKLTRAIHKQLNGVSEFNPDVFHTATDTAPTHASKVGTFIPKITQAEAGSASSKYVVIGWRYVDQGGTPAWVEQRVLTGN